MWHAGSYDPMTSWVDHPRKSMGKTCRKSMFWCYDHNYFATEFIQTCLLQELLKYKGMFGMTAETLKDANDNIVITGWSWSI